MTTGCGVCNDTTGVNNAASQNLPDSHYAAKPSYPVQTNPEAACLTSAKDIIYRGGNLPKIGVTNGMRLTEVLVAINAAMP